MICSTDKVQQLSTARVLACIAIVILHTVFASNEYFSDTLTASENLFSRIVENNMMWAVPTFVMVTGALQLRKDKKLTYKKLYGKYVLRILVALISCCIVFRTFDIIMDGEVFTINNLCLCFSELITGECWGHLWYLYLLIGLYVLLPFYRMIAANSTDKELLYLAGTFFVFISLIPLTEELGIHIGFYISESIIYPLYLFLGYMIFDAHIRVSIPASIILVTASTSCIILLDYLKYSLAFDIPTCVFGYSSPLVILQAVGIFALICESKQKKSKAFRIGITTFDECSFGIYLIHMVFVRFLFRYMEFNPYNEIAIIILPAAIVLILIISFIITYALRRIPGVNKVL